MEKTIQKEKIFLPDYNGGSIVNIPSSILQLFGIDSPSPPLKKDIFPVNNFKDFSKVVLFLFDSLGYTRVKKLRVLDDFNIAPITSVFPSTTVAAFTSLYTGVPPSVHGMIGYRLFLKEFGVITNMIKLSPVGFTERDVLPRIGLKPTNFLSVKTIFEILKTNNIETYAFTKMQYYKSALSQLMLKGAKVLPYINIVDLLINVRKILKKTKGRVFVTVYVDDFDTAAHYYGTETEEESVTTEVFLTELKELFLSKIPEGVLPLLASDHGQMPAPSSSKVDLTKHKWLFRNMVMPPTGEFRATYLHFRDGGLKKIENRIREELSNKFVILTKEEAIHLNLFGEDAITEKAKERVGDLILISKGSNYLFYPYSEFELKARHGGLNKNEVLVPFVVLI